MSNDGFTQIRHTLQAWRDQGTDRNDAPAFAFMRTLLTRAEHTTDPRVRRVLQTRLQALTERYAARIHEADSNTASPGSEPAAAPMAAALPRSHSLAALTHEMTRAAAGAAQPAADTLLNLRAHYPELPVIDDFRTIWSRVSANRRVQQSEEQVHANAGPLNSGHLVHRTLSFMRDVSPGYLHQFLSYLDDLAWVEQLHIASAPPPKESKRGAAKTPKKRAARKTTRKASGSA